MKPIVSYCYGTGSENTGIVGAMFAQILIFLNCGVCFGFEGFFLCREGNVFSCIQLCDYCNQEEEPSSSIYPSESVQCRSKGERNLIFLYRPEMHASWERCRWWSPSASPDSGGEAECTITLLEIHALVYCFLVSHRAAQTAAVRGQTATCVQQCCRSYPPPWESAFTTKQITGSCAGCARRIPTIPALVFRSFPSSADLTLRPSQASCRLGQMWPEVLWH